MDYRSLDELAKDFPAGTRIRYRAFEQPSRIAMVLGYVWSIPKQVGGDDEPALVVDTPHGTVGNVYPSEVEAKQ